MKRLESGSERPAEPENQIEVPATVAPAGPDYDRLEETAAAKEAAEKLYRLLGLDAAIIVISAAIALTVAHSGRYETLVCTLPLLMTDFIIFLGATYVRMNQADQLRNEGQIPEMQEDQAYKDALAKIGADEVINQKD